MTHHPQDIMTSDLGGSGNGSISTDSEVSDDAADEAVSELKPSVSCCVKDSSDVHVGTRNQYNAPVTVQKYKVTVNNEIPGFNFVPDLSVAQLHPCFRLLPAETHPGPTEKTKPSEDPNYHTSNLNVNKGFQQAPWRSVPGLRFKCGNKNTGICAGILIAVILMISVTVTIYYLGDETSNPSAENSFSFTVQTSYGNDSVYVGTEYVFWEVKVNATFMPEFQWFGPQGEVSLQGNTNKYLISGSSGRIGSVLKLFNVTLSDAGEYRLHVFNKERPQVKKIITITLTIKIPNPPDMIPNLEEVELQRGEKITLECTALNPITWSYPRQKVNRPAIGEANAYITEIRRLQYYLSTLRISRAGHQDTGFYGCTVNETSMYFYPITTTRIYIYVRDEEHLLVGEKDSIVFLDVSSFEPFVIPCRTTTTDINISLVHTFVPSSSNKNFGEHNNINTNINNNNVNVNNKPNSSIKVISYDRKVGYTLEPVNQDIALTCRATSGNKTEEILYVVSVFRRPKKQILSDRVSPYGYQAYDRQAHFYFPILFTTGTPIPSS